MTLVIRERRHKQALRLSLPKAPSMPSHSDFQHQIHVPASSPSSHVDPSPAIIKDLSDLEKLAVLGHGNGGTVYKVYHYNTRSFYALKVLRLHESALGIRQPATLEAEILKRVDSPYIVRCHAVFDNGKCNNDGDKGGDVSFVMEYMEGGSLHDVLREHRLPEEVISVLARRVLEGLNYLHGMNIVHRDIKPSNLLVNDRLEVKIADFGVSHLVEGRFEGNDYDAGTCAYMSPERIDRERWGGENANEFTGDVWSMGVVMLECLLGYFPLIGPGQRPDWATLMCAICFGEKLEMPEKASPEFQNFVRRCLEKNWRKRATVLELLHHPFVTQKICCSSDKELGNYVLGGS